MDLFTLLSKYAALAGVAAFVTVLVNVLKALHVVKDGASDKWALGLNTVFFTVFVFLGLFKAPIEQNAIDEIARVAAAVLGLILQWITSPLVHSKLVGLPLVGKSYSLQRRY